MPYQLAPALAAVGHGATRMLIADDVGLGKTVQAGVLLAELTARSAEMRALVLVPAGLREQWRSELIRQFRLASVDADAYWLRSIAVDRPADVNPWALAGIYVASHDFVKRPEVLRPLEDIAWDLVVVDEAHAMGTGTDRRAAAHAIARRSRRVMLLTATPHWDDPRAFGALCAIGGESADPAPILVFHRQRGDVTPASHRRSVMLTVTSSAAERRMHALLSHYTARVWREARARQDEAASLVAVVLRKRALSSAASLARSIRRRLDLLTQISESESCQLILPLSDEDSLEDDEPAGILAVPGLANPQHERDWLAAIDAAAREASVAETKTRRLVRLLSRLQEPVIVFTEYRDTLSMLHRAISPTGRRVLVMHGGMSPHERSDVRRDFNERDAVLLATDAAAEGLNLHHRCRVLVHYELPWSPSRLEQRAGRVDRLGQARRVHEIALAADDTAEEVVLAPLVRKAAESRRAGKDDGLVRTLSEHRIAESILGHRPLPPAPAVALPGSTSKAADSLDADAAAEVERLEHHRRLLALADAANGAVSDGRWPTLVITPRRSGGLRPGLILVYTTVVFEPAGQRLHGESIGIHLALASGRRISRRGSALGRLLRMVADSPPAPVGERLAVSRARARQLATTVYERVRAPVQARESEMRELFVSTAQQIVQAGLFDRRSLREAEHRRRVMDSHLRDTTPRHHYSVEALDIRTTLVAAVVVRPRRNRAT